jgi:hypothetical protein
MPLGEERHGLWDEGKAAGCLLLVALLLFEPGAVTLIPP